MSRSANSIRLVPSWGLVGLLLLALVILVLLTLNVISAVMAPSFMIVKSALLDENLQQSQNSDFSTLFMILVSYFLVFLSFTAYSSVLGLLNYNFLKSSMPALQSGDYDAKDVILRALKWNRKRSLIIFKPMLIFNAIILGLFLIATLFFNLFLYIAGISLALTTFTASITLLSLFAGYLITNVMTVWNTATSSFGLSIAISEPDLSYKTIRARSRKLAFIIPKNFGLYLLHILFAIFMIVQFLSVILFPEIINSDNMGNVIGFITFDSLLLVWLVYLKACFYKDSLMYQYNKIKPFV